jgi:hypothetical protein
MYRCHLFLPTACVVVFSSLLLSGISSADDLSSARENCARAQLHGLWEPRSEILGVIVTSKFETEASACIRTMQIVRQRTEHADEPLYQEKMAERPIAVWPLGGRLLTLWESGSALWVTVYSIDGQSIKKILDVRPKGFPEIAFSKDGSERLSFSNYEARDGANGRNQAVPVSADVYAWVNGRYVKRVAVPWSRRFDE